MFAYISVTIFFNIYTLNTLTSFLFSRGFFFIKSLKNSLLSQLGVSLILLCLPFFGRGWVVLVLVWFFASLNISFLSNCQPLQNSFSPWTADFTQSSSELSKASALLYLFTVFLCLFKKSSIRKLYSQSSLVHGIYKFYKVYKFYKIYKLITWSVMPLNKILQLLHHTILWDCLLLEFYIFVQFGRCFQPLIAG